ncbi:hypothetical protein GCM10017786_13080 [Amycolatopsis deserti]|uniref:ApeA N-terminal domain-containing protein n=1 Tax=Amycolatopsis deserti TaxID=185696 RepID=A0ABQ3IKC8_9PSEU|nr:HEPN domain-containing protein [Amycolatopsis deserti]GHE83379.1 hypothetical protein GCM10017786_13080 [Amycolatopsis deserti]
MGEAEGNHLLGKFWLADQPERQLTGWLDLSGARPKVTLNGQLTPAVVWTPSPDGAGAHGHPADDTFSDGGLTIHGLLAEGARRAVTVFDAITRSRRYDMMAVNDDSDGVHVLQGTWLARGAHLDDNEEILSARIRFTNLDEWIGQSGVTGKVIYSPHNHVHLDYVEPHPEAVPIPAIGGTVGTQFATIPPRIEFNGAEVRHKAWIQFKDVSLPSFAELLHRLVSPTLTLASVMMRKKCVLTELSILTGKDELSCEVSHPLVDSAAKDEGLKPGNRSLGLRDVGIGVVAEWIAKSDDFNPIPNIIYSTFGNDRARTLESELLELAAAAEGFDRRRFGEEAVFDRVLAKSARRAAIQAAKEAAGEELAERLGRALANFNSLAYAERLRRLLQLTHSAVPEAAGNWDIWIKRVKEARNGYAHQLERGETQWEVELVLVESLRWILGAAILLESGVSAGSIADNLKNSQDYIFFKRKSRALAPQIYGTREGPE